MEVITKRFEGCGADDTARSLGARFAPGGGVAAIGTLLRE